MSARDRELIISPRARRDFAGLLAYSERRWGREQRAHYKAKIDQALNGPSRFPDRGLPRDDIVPALRGRLVGDHIIYYRAEDHAITVVRILHRRRDQVGQLAGS